MNLIVMNDVHAVLNIREDLMPQFKIGGTFKADVPALDKKDIEFRIYYISAGQLRHLEIHQANREL